MADRHATAPAATRADLERAIEALEAQRPVLGDAAVDAAQSGLRSQLEALAPGDGERRAVLTVLFADLEGFTAMSDSLDPEDVREIVGRCFSAWRGVIEEHGGVVEKYIGDAVMAVFGLHRSDEDDAVRAVRAGGAMVTALGSIADDVEPRHGVRLHMRVGIDTGQVVVSTIDDRDGQGFVAVGPAVNRASRLQSAAPRDMVLISAATRRHVRGRFGLDAQSQLRLKGLDEPVDAFVVLSERPVGFELEPATGIAGVVVETVGRDLELLTLKEHLADVVGESRWRVLTIVGEAGVGKSRLLHELDAWLVEQPETYWWLRGRAAPAARNRPHGVLRDLVATRFRISPQDSAATVRERSVAAIEAAFGRTSRTDADAALLTRWLGLETGADARATDPQTLNNQASALLARYVATLSERAPVVVLLEDLHWADDASLAWVDAAHPVLRDRPVLVVATARGSFLQDRPHWGEGLSQHARLDLGPLSRRHSRALLDQLISGVVAIPAELSDMLVDRADGNPYYLEELVGWLLDSGTIRRTDDDGWQLRDDGLESLRVPSTLHGLLQARLDALPPEQRSVLQAAAVVGRVFWEDALVQLSDDAERHDVPAVLAALRAEGLVQQRATSGFESTQEYLFKHALLRDVAYESQLRPHRRRRHAQVADWLVGITEPTGRTDEVAALVAEHLDRAGRADAATWYLRAGRRAAEVFAVEEAKGLFARGLQLAAADDVDLRIDLMLADETVADRQGDRDRQRVHLEAMTALVPAVSSERRVEHLLTRARFAQATSDYVDAVRWAELARVAAADHGLDREVARAHLWKGKAYTWMAQSEPAHQALGTAIEVAHGLGERQIEADATRYLAMLLTNESDLHRGLEVGERARALFAAESDLEGEGTALAQLSTTSYYLGRLDEARSYLELALPMFERSGRLYAKTVALSNVGSIAAAQGRLALAMRSVLDAVGPSEQMEDFEGGSVNFLMIAEIEIQLGRWADALAHVDESDRVAAQVATDALRSTRASLRAQALSALGRHEEALQAAEMAILAAQPDAMAREAAAAHLTQGYVLVHADRAEDAVDSFDRAHTGYAELGIHGYAWEAVAGVADCHRRLGMHEQAVATIEPVLDHLEEDDLAGANADHARLACWLVLRDADDPRADAVGTRARELLQERAARIGDAEMEREFLSRPVAQSLLAG